MSPPKKTATPKQNKKTHALKFSCNVRFIVNGPFFLFFILVYVIFIYHLMLHYPFAFLSCVMFNVRNLMVAKSCMHDGILFNS